MENIRPGGNLDPETILQQWNDLKQGAERAESSGNKNEIKEIQSKVNKCYQQAKKMLSDNTLTEKDRKGLNDFKEWAEKELETLTAKAQGKSVQSSWGFSLNIPAMELTGAEEDIDAGSSSSSPESTGSGASSSAEGARTHKGYLSRLGQSIEKREPADEQRFLGGREVSEGQRAQIEQHRNPRAELTNSTYSEKCPGAVQKEEFGKYMQELELSEAPDRRAIQLAEARESSVSAGYDKIGENVAAGYYNPAIIPFEANVLFGPPDLAPADIKDEEDLLSLLSEQLMKVGQNPENRSEPNRNFCLTEHQKEYVWDDVVETISLFRDAYPEKSLQEAFTLGRDLIRMMAYQEMFDKGSFTGSDHGCKHMHNNIQGARHITAGMDHCRESSPSHSHKTESEMVGTAKDRFLVRFIHILHDVGYTVGFSQKSFAACSDHPYIGAKMIEEHKEYFQELLGIDGYKALHFSILQHAGMMPDLADRSADRKGGVNVRLIRSLTSISDACAVSFDRKTQFFWEQPGPLKALTQLRCFLTQFPEYKGKLANPANAEKLLKSDSQIDQLAGKIFLETKEKLKRQADKVAKQYENEGLAILFKQAIDAQFNSFTTQITLGQYGSVITGLSARTNEACENPQTPEHPEFLTEIGIAPSLIYGVLNDVFGQDIAAASFKKLVEEFHGDVNGLMEEVEKQAEAQAQGEAGESEFNTGVGVFVVHSGLEKPHTLSEHHRFSSVEGEEVMATPRPITENPAGYEHLEQMMGNTERVRAKLAKLKENQIISRKEWSALQADLANWKKSGEGTLFDIMQEHIMTNLTPEKTRSLGNDFNRFIEFISDNEEKIRAAGEGAFQSLSNILGLFLMSDLEYAYMLPGAAEELSRANLIRSELDQLESL